ncbi:hypothetical protein F0224_14915 [Vibrio coralliilyticus]|uniref:hypothetical protein n=1 Tax=Vibrio coralliilyticus TaxID=190893 RepID=UPI000BAC2120|nr:hypothetical protein [Vibrio coralliilyticus]NOI76979.1 hypothetical protein [Vibrio coralliilyticus]PAW01612.1 hypothetical protein CKJ79_19880 [Vibrio coralliilyticus]
MKRLVAPDYADNELTTEASENSSMGSYPFLQEQLEDVTGAYDNYVALSGNALRVSPINITDDLASALKVHYTSEPKCFSFIPTLRKSSRRVCPMCGSLGTGTLDHLLPQALYPEFAVFSKNLVPACDCNSKRKEVVTGVCTETGNPVRVLHPYFDDCLSERQIYFSIVPDPEYPLARFELRYINPTSPQYDSIRFHVEKVVVPSGICDGMDDMWSSLADYPSDKIHTIPSNTPISLDKLNTALFDALGRHDREKTTPNNWESIFVYSIIESESAKEWIVQKHNEIISE